MGRGTGPPRLPAAGALKFGVCAGPILRPLSPPFPFRPMAPPAPRSPAMPTRSAGLHQPPLPRQLLALGLARAGEGADASAPGGPGLAERLAPWLAWTDAIALAAALDAAPPPPAQPARADALRRELLARADAERAALEQAIAADQPLDARPGRVDPVRGPVRDPHDHPPAQRYRAHQRAMAQRLAPLRASARAALAARSPALARVALLDQLLEQALAARERQLLDALPAWLERRLQRQPADPATLMWPLLRAELAHRLQPLDGLLATLRAAPTSV